jgi:hypothetical protein
MNLVYFSIAAIFALLGRAALQRFTENTSILSLFTAVIVVIVMLLTKAFIIPYYHAQTYQFFLQEEDPQMRVIMAKYPKEFDTYIKSTKSNLLTDDSDYRAALDKIIFLNSLFVKAVPTATNESIYNYYKTELELYNVLFRVNPWFVLYMEFSDQFARAPKPRLILSIADASLIKKYVDDKEAVVISSLQNPQPRISASQKSDAANVLNDIMVQIGDEYGKDTFANTLKDPDNTDLNPELSGAMVIGFYKKIVSLGADYTGLIFKYLDNHS